MWNDVNGMLKKAADCQKLAEPEDVLSAILREISAETELDESALDQVAAAAQFPRSPADWKKKKR